MKATRARSKLKAYSLTVWTVFGLLLSTSLQSQADTLSYLGQGKQFLIKMANMIDGAQKSIDMSYYIFRPCAASTKILINKLERKASEGVKVRLFLDGWPNVSNIKKGLQETLRKKGIEMRYYNRKGMNVNINHRMHGKIILVDSKRYITGGRNIDDNYFSASDYNFIDRDVFVEGDSAKVAQVIFDRLWNTDFAFTMGSATAEQLAEFEKTCMKEDDKMVSMAAAIEAESAATLAENPDFQCNNVKFTMDDPKFWLNYSVPNQIVEGASSSLENREAIVANKETSRSVMEFIDDATKNLVIENWGYIPSAEISWALRKLRSNKTPILVVTNREMDEGEAASRMNQYYSRRDNKDSQRILNLSTKGSMNDRWSQTPKDAWWMIHSKVLVSNFENVAITSFNFDPRSYHTNIESGLFVRNCAPFAQHVLNVTGQLVDAFELDKDCVQCRKKLKSSFFNKLTDWVQHELL